MPLSPNFEAAIAKLRELADYDRYLGLFVFGSAARGDVSSASDLDVKVIVDTSDCTAISHPFICDIKLDISFLTISQLQEGTAKEIDKAERIPMLAESLILFDKTGQVGQLKQLAVQATPKELTDKDKQFLQFLIYHIHAKASRHLQTDPASALLVMHTSLNDLIKYHYRIQRKWLVSDKRLMADLRSWDPIFARLLEQLVVTSDCSSKYQLFEQLIDLTVKPLGGRLAIAENNCTCTACRQDLRIVSGLNTL
jgi:hypothetical protein